MSTEMERCPWCGKDPVYQHYHDHVWGRPVFDDLELFQKLCLDGQQAGLSWITILKKQGTYQQAYDDFDPSRIVRYDAAKVEALMQNPGIIRNRLKIQSIIKNARAYLDLIDGGQSFSHYLWEFVEGRPVQNKFTEMEQVPVSTTASEAMSKALKKRGFTFVGPTICYAFMQAVGMVNDHLQSCPQWQACYQLSN